MSSTSTTRRSRSGCQVRTTTLRLRALARQSIERTSSPRTYSRSESNSVPWPRTRTAARPSSSRSRASRLRQVLARLERRQRPDRPGTSSVAWRAASPSGPRSRTVTPTARRSPRRRGRRACAARTRSPRGEVDPVPVAGGAGGGLPGVAHQRRGPGAAPVLVDQQRRLGRRARAGPCRSAGGSRQRARRRREQQVDGRPASTTTSSHSHTVPTLGAQHDRHQPEQQQQRDPTGDGHQLATQRGTGTEPSAEAEHLGRRRRPRARPRGAARAGARGWRARAPSRRRASRSRGRSATPRPGPARSSAVAPRGLTPRLSDGDSRVARAMSTM